MLKFVDYSQIFHSGDNRMDFPPSLAKYTFVLSVWKVRHVVLKIKKIMAVNRHRYKGVISYVDGPYQTYTFTVYTKLRGDGPYFWATLENAKGDLKEVYDFQEYEDVERYFEILKNEIKAGENL